MSQENEEYHIDTEEKAETEVVKYQDGISVKSDEDYVYIESYGSSPTHAQLISFDKVFAEAMCKAILHHAS